MLDQIPDTFSLWLLNYGPFAIFGLLAVGIIALPVPEESLMLLAGIMMGKGLLHPVHTVLAAYLGCLSGITVSYFLGRSSDNFLIKRFGKTFGLTEERMARFHAWFAKFGKWALFFGYFVPGVRHFTGFSAGLSGLPYKSFALFAYTGAIVWASTFLSLGFFFGEYSTFFFEVFEEHIDTFASIVITLTVIFYLLRFRLED
jgi:membrane protein DedA with SNARE-associated domain